MESIKCNLCGADGGPVLFRKKDKFKISDEAFNVVKCNRCGLLYLNPRPGREEIARFYPGSYSWKEDLEATSSLTRLLREMERRGPPGRLPELWVQDGGCRDFRIRRLCGGGLEVGRAEGRSL
jgi:hypothetical protein